MDAGAAGSLTGAAELFRFWVFPDCTFLDISKVLGYRFYERHKRFISVNLLENIAVVILICIVSLFISNASVGIALLVGALLTIIEMAIIFTNVMWVEKTNISKSLKGGCL